jgi:lipopolysaccharide/colanic/teichoic acid biosynthesis glycosyltransferase
VALATIIAEMLRGNFETVSASLAILTPYTFVSVGCASIIFLLVGLDRTPWRYSTVADHLQVIVLTVLAILLALVLTFALNRLAPVARSLPVAQGALIITFLISARSVARFWYARQIHSNGTARTTGQPHETILIVGVTTMTELLLLSVQEFASQRIQVVGVLSEESSMRGRAIQQKPVLGSVEELQEILHSLEVHGVAVDKIIVATAADRLRPPALDKLLEIEKSSDIVVQFLSERLGFDDIKQPPVLADQKPNSGMPEPRTAAQLGNVAAAHHPISNGKYFRLGKRIVDVFGAAVVTIAVIPVLLLGALVVALDVGFPVIFWQQRPGLYGRPFKLYKFRTMRAPHDRHKRRIPDDQRSSVIGRILRRCRVDELPQLYNVLVGDMSLIGPRPLLPCDQSPDYAARLSVRPGITGWAQINGGRIISPSDKCMLDIWYAQNVSFVLDFKIVLSTLKMVAIGDRINSEAVHQARSSLGLRMRLRTKMVPAE